MSGQGNYRHFVQRPTLHYYILYDRHAGRSRDYWKVFYMLCRPEQTLLVLSGFHTVLSKLPDIFQEYSDISR